MLAPDSLDLLTSAAERAKICIVSCSPQIDTPTFLRAQKAHDQSHRLDLPLALNLILMKPVKFYYIAASSLRFGKELVVGFFGKE